MTNQKTEQPAPSIPGGHALTKGRIGYIMRDIFISHYHKRTRNAVMEYTAEDLFRLSAATGFVLEDTHPAKEIISILRRTDTSYRRPFVLYVKGLRCAEISKQLHLPVNTVKDRIYYIIRKLKCPDTSRDA